MNRKTLLPTLLLSLFLLPAYAQETIERKDYALPVKLRYKPTLSANFGELRTLNLHTGIDIKTGGVEGLPIVAADDGYIYRISIRPSGYGLALYMAHPDGRSTVYGHLSRFTPEMEAYARERQYKEKKNTIDIFVPAGKFVFRRGEVIGYSGNSGRSYGPHLHFEIRDMATDRLYNPLKAANFSIHDNIPPEIHRLYYFTVDSIAGVPFHRMAESIPVRRVSKGVYEAERQPEVGGKGYFALEVIDYKNNSSNTNAVHSIRMSADGAPRFEYVMNSTTFSEATYVPAVAVYHLNIATRNHVVRLARMARAELPFYGGIYDQGLIDPARDGHIGIEVEDDNGNISTLELDIINAPWQVVDTILLPPGAVRITGLHPFSRSTDGLTVTIPARTLFEPIFYWQRREVETPEYDKESAVVVLSDLYTVFDESVPLRSGVNITIEEEIPEQYRGKAVLARLCADGKLASAGGKYSEGKVACQGVGFGTYCLAADTKAPQVSAPFKKGADMGKATTMVFNVKDDFTGIAQYELEIDGKWAIVEYDYLRDRLIHRFDDQRYGKGKMHKAVVRVADGVGNKTVYSTTYYR